MQPRSDWRQGEALGSRKLRNRVPPTDAGLRALGALEALRAGMEWVDLPDGRVALRPPPPGARRSALLDGMTLGEACYLLACLRGKMCGRWVKWRADQEGG